MASFFIVVVFLPHNEYRCKLRSTGRLSARARSNRRHSGEASKTMDYKSVFTNLCLELQQNRSWIKGLGKNPFTHSIPFTHSLTAVPFVRGHRSVFPRTPRNPGVYTRHPTFVTATSGVLTRLPAWLSKNRMRVYTLSDMRSEKNCVCTRPPKRRG